ncbi:MAG: hypothetical protein ACRC9R_07000 [Enterovibrio sp.]
MFPNQPPTPPTTADASTSQTTAATTQELTISSIGQAIVAALNTVNMPETYDGGAVRQQERQARRVHPYRRPDPALPAQQPVATIAAQGPQLEDRAAIPSTSRVTAALGAPATQAPGQPVAQAAQLTGRHLVLRDENDTASVASLQQFFNALSRLTGLMWTGSYTGVVAAGRENRNLVGYGSVPAATLSFQLDSVPQYVNQQIRELLERVNNEKKAEVRAFLLVKALRACSESIVLWPGALMSFGFLLGLNSNAVVSWSRSLPGCSTVVPIGASGDRAALPLSVAIPVDVLSWPELVRLLQERFHLQLRGDTAAPSLRTEEASTMGLYFEQPFIDQQERGIAAQLRRFNSENDPQTRDILFARIICALKDNYSLPFGTFFQVCKWLRVQRGGISSWFSKYCKKNTTQPAAVPVPQSLALQPIATASTSAAATAPLPPVAAPQAAQALMPQAAVVRAPAPSLTPAVVTAQMQPLPPPVPPAVSMAQARATAATKPVFAGPIAGPSSAVTGLAPTLPPFVVPTTSAEMQLPEEDAFSTLGLNNNELDDLLGMNENAIVQFLTNEEEVVSEFAEEDDLPDHRDDTEK